MSKLQQKIDGKLKSISNIECSSKVIKTVSETSRVVLNKSIEMKLLQNKKERIASEELFYGKIM